MRKTIFAWLFPLLVAVPAFAVEEAPPMDVGTEVLDLQKRMEADPDVMSLIRTLQDDPDMQAALSDPGLLSDVLQGNVDALAKNPKFLRLLENSRVREIQRKMK